MRQLLSFLGFLLFVACAVNVKASNPRVIAVREGRIALAAAPVSVTLDLGRGRAQALAVARDSKRTLMLRVEGISVEGSPVVYNVYVGKALAGTLATYGAEEQNGKFIVAIPIDAAAAPTLAKGARRLTVRFVPTARGAGVVRFLRLRLVEE